MNLMSDNNGRTIEKIIRLMQADESIDAPEDAVRRAKNIFRLRVAEPKKSIAQKILAVLQIDLSGARPAFGERSSASSSSQTRQMLFQAGENAALDIRITKIEKNFDLRGQILGEGFADCIIKLGEFETTANELGEFKLADVPGGIYKLNAQSGEREIVVSDLELK